jgi:hypothetical protein
VKAALARVALARVALARVTLAKTLKEVVTFHQKRVIR